MTADTLRTRCSLRSTLLMGFVGLCALVGCKSTDKEPKGMGMGVGKGKSDVLIAGPNLIPKQNVPVPARAGGPKGKGDILTTPTGTGDKAGYTDSSERFDGVYLPGKTSTPAALAGRIKDGEELKIASPGVTLTPTGGTTPAEAPAFDSAVDPLFTQLEKFGVTRTDRSLVREGGKYVFRASLPLGGNGAKREYTGVGATAYEAVKGVVDQLPQGRK